MAEALDLREMPLEDFSKFVQGLQLDQPRPQRQGELDVTQLPINTRQAFDAASAVTRVQPGDYVSPEGKRMGIRPGAFLDTQQGAPASVRARLGLDENQLNQFKLLSHIYGPGKVELSDKGRFIVRGQGSDGKTDIMVDPVGFDVGDVAQMSGQILPMIAGAIAGHYGAKLGSGPFTKVLGATTGMALAQEVTGAGQDAFVRWLRDNDVNFSDIAKHRAALAVADEGLGMLAAGATKTMATTAEGLAGLLGYSAGTTATKAAANELASQTGVNYPLSPGQETRSKLLQRIEALAGGKPGSASAIDQIRARQQSAEDELRRVFLGLPRTMSDEELNAAIPQADVTGQKALRRLRLESSNLEGNVQRAATDIQQTGTREAQSLANVNLASPADVTEVGKQVRERALNEFAQFKADMGARYEEFLSRPEIRARTVSGNDLAKAATQVENDFVPKARQGAVTQPLEAFVPAKFRSFVDQLTNLKGKTVSVNDLKRIRTAIDNGIKEGVAIPGTDVAQLESLRDAVDNSISGALKDMDKLPSAYKDTAPLTIWNNLRQDYATGIGRFDKVGIRDMLVQEGEKGSIGNTALAESITGNSPQALDRYNALKEFLGESSPEFQRLKQVAAQDALGGSLNRVTNFIDGQKLLNNLNGMRPEIARDLFGVNEAELRRIGEVLARSQGKLDTEELANLASSKSLTAQKLQGLIDAEDARATAYNNDLLRRAAKDPGSAGRVQPSDVVRYVTRMDKDDAAKLMGIWSDQPNLVQDIRQLGVEDLWSKATGSNGLVSSKSLTEAMGDPAQQRTWRVILGNDTVDSLQKLAEVTAPRDFSATTYKGASGLAGSSQVSQIFMKGEGSAIKEAASNFLLGFLYSGPMKKAVTNLAMSTDRGRLLNGVIASTPFIEAAVNRFGSDGAALVMNELRQLVEPMQKKELFIQGKLPKDALDPGQLSRDEFARWASNQAGSLDLPKLTKPRKK